LGVWIAYNLFNRSNSAVVILASPNTLDHSANVRFVVISTLTRSVYTSLTTLLPLVALIFFGGSTLFWFAIALSFGILIGAWSSIAVAPTLLPVLARR
jgi:preprotein translocase subunit SecF